jgi:hypothetical protein
MDWLHNLKPMDLGKQHLKLVVLIKHHMVVNKIGGRCDVIAKREMLPIITRVLFYSAATRVPNCCFTGLIESSLQFVRDYMCSHLFRHGDASRIMCSVS